MKVLILGGSGMLGHRLWMSLQDQYDVYVTVRNQTNPFPNVPEFPQNKVICGVEGLITESVLKAITQVKPEVVINCIGIIKQLDNANPLDHIRVNALLPHLIALWCATANIRLIHISTDCVFSGNKGSYRETDEPDPVDLYGRTKLLGELNYPHCITLRTSIIGLELKNYLGLVEWFLRQSGTVKGYTNAIYTGLTTRELSKVIKYFVIPRSDLFGVHHVSSWFISKYELLNTIKGEFGKKVNVMPYPDFYCDRSLVSTVFQSKTGYAPALWAQMVKELFDDYDFYKELREKTWQNGRLPVRL